MSDNKMELYRERIRKLLQDKRLQAEQVARGFDPQVTLQKLLQKNLESFEGAPPFEERRLPLKTPRFPLTKVLPSKIPRLPLEGKKVL